MHTRLACAVLAGLLCPMAMGHAAEPLSISGLVAQPVRLTMEALRKLPASRVSISQVSNSGASVALDCGGPALSHVLATAKFALPDVKNANLRHTLLITAEDGYAIALSLGEIDPKYGNATPMLATQCNGQSLEAPRLVMPKDTGASRSIHGVVSIQVR